MTEVRKHKTLEEILENTERDGDCMIWQGGKHRQNYGMMRQRGEMRTVHSVVAELVYGYKPDKYHGERVVRTCDNNLCVSPDHVIIEQTANLTRKRYHCKNRKLTQEQVREIRQKYAEGSWGIGSRLAKEYNVSSYVIYATVSHRIYKELPDENG
jgi:hypothetical protein